VTKLDEVLAEEWQRSMSSMVAYTGGFAAFGGDAGGLSERDGIRAAVAVLGKRALALVLKLEASGDVHGEVEHGPLAAEWGAIVEEARKLG
jgi:hypothetical protein